MSIDVSKMPKIGFGLMRLPETDGVIDLDANTGHVFRGRKGIPDINRERDRVLIPLLNSH